MLSNASGEEWKDIRSCFSPIFTSGKMKGMLALIKEAALGLTKELEEKADMGAEFDLKLTFGKFSMEALASSVFGVHARSFSNAGSVFVNNAAAIFLNSPLENFLLLIKFIPGVIALQKFLNINTFKPGPTKYLADIIKRALKERRDSGGRRNDMIDLMLDCIKEEGTVEGGDTAEDNNQFDKDMKLDHAKKQGKVSEEEIVATAIVFLVAGYDTTGMTLSFLAYAMSKNPEVQERLHQEVDQAFEDNDGEMPDYQTILQLPYVEMVVLETLRMFSPVGMNTRTCTKDYQLPGSNITLRRGDYLSFTPLGIHMDPEHYSHPKEFYPDHFGPEEKAARHP